MNFEEELRAALRHEPAPEDFAAKVFAKTTLAKTTLVRKHREGPRVVPIWRRPLSLAIAAALAVAAVVPPAVYQYHQRQRALEARDQLIAALSITRVQLQQVKARLQRNTRHKI
jgi:hypothetical protein